MEVARRISGDQGAAMAHVILTHHQIALLVQKASEGVVPGHVFGDAVDNLYHCPGTALGLSLIHIWVTTQELCPHKAITREQIAAILYRYYADYLGNTPSSASLNGYTDQDAVSGFARDAMAWAVCSGLIRGVNASNEAPRLDPKATSNRAQVATLMHRLDVILDGGSLCRCV